jgi:hypothetical protein
MRRARTCVALAVAATLASGTRLAADGHRFAGAFGGSGNPLGLQARLGAEWRWGLTDSHSPLVRDAHVALGVTNVLSPSYDRLEAHLELSPLAILDLRARADYVVFFGTFGNLTSFPSYDADFGDDARDERRDEARAADGFRFQLAPTLKGHVGRVSIRLRAELERWQIDGIEPYFYEPSRGTLLRAGGDSLVAGSAVLLVDLGGRRFQAGLQYDLVDVLDAPQNRIQRLGPLLRAHLGERRLGLRQPILVAGVFHYLEAPNRAGLAILVAVTFGRTW